MANESPRRIVVWSDGCAQAEHTVAWAARHAATRSVPLHIVQFSAAPAPGGPGEPGGPRGPGGSRGPGGPSEPRGSGAPGGETAHSGFAERDPGAVDVVRVAHEMRRIEAAHGKLPVTFEVLHDPSPQRIVATCDEGDVLVTDQACFLRLTGSEADVNVPVVIVPEHVEAVDGERGVLLVPGHRFSSPVAAFGFRAAADLGLDLDLVHTAPQSPAFGDDYWIDAGGSTSRGEQRWQAESAHWRARFPEVTATSWVLRTQPAETMENMARSARLAVVGSGARRELRALLDADACPVAVIPEP